MNPRRRVTEDGIEETFAVNYLALSADAWPARTLRASGRGRVINIGSAGHYRAVSICRFAGASRYGCVRAYNQSKLALVIFTYLLARQLRTSPIAVNCIHPGHRAHNIWPSERLHLRIGSASRRLLAYRPPQKAANDLVSLPHQSGIRRGHRKILPRLPNSNRAGSPMTAIQSRLWT